MRSPRVCVRTLVFLLGVEFGLTVGSFAWHSAPPGPCALGSRGRVCIVERETLAARVDAAGEPAAEAIPTMATSDVAVWLRVSGLPAGEPIALTVSAPDGTHCSVASDDIEMDGAGDAQAFVTPANCASAEGVWVATFAAGSVEAKARFLVVGVAGR